MKLVIAQMKHETNTFVGFPNADIEYAGLSTVVVTDGDAALAKRWRDEPLDLGPTAVLDPMPS